jgi:hypothetical protein
LSSKGKMQPDDVDATDRRNWPHACHSMLSFILNDL